MRNMRAIVTAGGTIVPLDDVRFISNRSRGSFPWAIARELAARGVQVTVIGSRDLHERVRETVPHGIVFRPFSTYDELAKAIVDETASSPPDMFFMAAAVSDYGADAATGKISSDQEEIVVHLRKLPKIIDTLRRTCGREMFIVGFKLTSGADDAHMIEAARSQIARCRLNLVVANDLSRIGNGRGHPILMVTPEGGRIPATGTKEEVARALVGLVLTRADTIWCRSERIGHSEWPFGRGQRHRRAASLLRLAQEMRLFSGTGGNISVQAKTRGVMWVTPRGADKRTVDASRLIHATVDLGAGLVSYIGGEKPSIDTSVQARIYRELPETVAIIHSHDAFVIPDAVTETAYPCGTQEEAGEICRALARETAAGFSADRGFAVELVHHGLIIGLTAEALARLAGDWSLAADAYRQHLREIGESDALARIMLTPVFGSARVIGVIARHPEGWVSPFLLPDARGEGFGPKLLRVINERRLSVAAHDLCGVEDYYAKRAFKLRERQGKIIVLDPPSLRRDLIEAATICLWHPPSRRILLARRSAGAWPGLWCHPGGKREKEEGLRECAFREFTEEIGFAPAGTVVAEHRAYTAFGDRAFDVRSFLVAVAGAREPVIIPNGEIAEARWVGIEESLSFPMAHGTKEIIRSFFERRK